MSGPQTLPELAYHAGRNSVLPESVLRLAKVLCAVEGGSWMVEPPNNPLHPTNYANMKYVRRAEKLQRHCLGGEPIVLKTMGGRRGCHTFGKVTLLHD